MTALVVTLFAHAGGRLAVLAAQTVDQTGRPGAVILGIVIAQLAIAALAVPSAVRLMGYPSWGRWAPRCWAAPC